MTMFVCQNNINDVCPQEKIKSELKDVSFWDAESGLLLNINPSREKYDFEKALNDNLKLISKEYIRNQKWWVRYRVCLLSMLEQSVKNVILMVKLQTSHLIKKLMHLVSSLILWKK